MKWKTFHAHIQEGFTPQGLRLIKRSFFAMDNAHDGEFRDDGRPYRVHLIDSFDRAYNMGERDPEVQAAILTHDMLESLETLGRPITVLKLVSQIGSPTACRVSWMTKRKPMVDQHVEYWLPLRGSKDHRTLKAKCYERQDNITTFKDMKAKPGETKKMRIRRKLDETVREFVPIVNWLLADVELRNFDSEESRNKERALINNIRRGFEYELGKYGRKFEINK